MFFNHLHEQADLLRLKAKFNHEAHTHTWKKCGHSIDGFSFSQSFLLFFFTFTTHHIQTHVATKKRLEEKDLCKIILRCYIQRHTLLSDIWCYFRFKSFCFWFYCAFFPRSSSLLCYCCYCCCCWHFSCFITIKLCAQPNFMWRGVMSFRYNYMLLEA